MHGADIILEEIEDWGYHCWIKLTIVDDHRYPLTYCQIINL